MEQHNTKTLLADKHVAYIKSLEEEVSYAAIRLYSGHIQCSALVGLVAILGLVQGPI